MASHLHTIHIELFNLLFVFTKLFYANLWWNQDFHAAAFCFLFFLLRSFFFRESIYALITVVYASWNLSKSSPATYHTSQRFSHDPVDTVGLILTTVLIFLFLNDARTRHGYCSLASSRRVVNPATSSFGIVFLAIFTRSSVTKKQDNKRKFWSQRHHQLLDNPCTYFSSS